MSVTTTQRYKWAQPHLLSLHLDAHTRPVWHTLTCPKSTWVSRKCCWEKWGCSRTSWRAQVIDGLSFPPCSASQLTCCCQVFIPAPVFLCLLHHFQQRAFKAHLWDMGSQKAFFNKQLLPWATEQSTQLQMLKWVCTLPLLSFPFINPCLFRNGKSHNQDWT